MSNKHLEKEITLKKEKKKLYKEIARLARGKKYSLRRDLKGIIRATSISNEIEMLKELKHFLEIIS